MSKCIIRGFNDAVAILTEIRYRKVRISRDEWELEDMWEEWERINREPRSDYPWLCKEFWRIMEAQ